MSTVQSSVPMGGELTMKVVRQRGLPQRGLPTEINEWRMRNAVHLLSGVPRIMAARALALPHFYGAIYGTVFRGDGTVEELGLMGLKLVTTAGVTKIVDFLRANDTTTATNFKFHGFGTGSTAEATADTALVTEETTQYVTDNTRPTGTQTNNGATVYRTVATYAPDSGGTRAITEHGVFSAATAGTLLDRTVFSAVNLVASADSLQITYDLTVAAGG
jgi:hypothetical protein